MTNEIIIIKIQKIQKKFIAGTLPLNMYRSSPLDYHKEKTYLFQTNEQEETISAQEVQEEEKEQEDDKEVSTNP